MSSEFPGSDFRNRKLCSILAAMTRLQPKNKESKDPAAGELEKCIQKYFEICIQDQQNTDVHRCTRDQCQTYCILPIYARRCMSNEKVNELFKKLKEFSDEHPSSIDYLSESKIATNLLIHIASDGNNSLKDSYDVLYAMAGHRGIIFNPESNVDSKLYELLFDLFTDCENQSLQPASLTLLNVHDSQSLAADIARLDNERENMENMEISLLLPSTETTTTPVPEAGISASETSDVSAKTRILENPRINTCSTSIITRLATGAIYYPHYDSLDLDDNPRRSGQVDSTQRISNSGLPSYEEALATLPILTSEMTYV